MEQSTLEHTIWLSAFAILLLFICRDALILVSYWIKKKIKTRWSKVKGKLP